MSATYPVFDIEYLDEGAEWWKTKIARLAIKEGSLVSRRDAMKEMLPRNATIISFREVDENED